MSHNFQVALSESHIRTAYRHFQMRRLGLPGLAFLLFLFTLLVYLLISRRTDWFLGLVGGSFLICIVATLVRYLLEARNAKAIVEKLGDGVVDYEVSDDSLRQSHCVATTEIRADMIRAILKFPKVWLLLFNAQRGYLVLPASQLSRETQAAFQRMVLSAGGRVDGAT